MNVFGAILKIGYYIFFGALLAIAILVLVSAFPIQGNIQIKVVESGSMEPQIKTGSVVLIKPFSAYDVGDVVTFDSNFRSPNGAKVPVTHRIVGVKNEPGGVFYLTKGDANEEADSNTIRREKVIGKVLFSAPYVGYAVEAAKRPYGFLAIIVIPALIVIYDEGVKIFKEVKRMYGKKKKDNELAKEQELNL